MWPKDRIPVLPMNTWSPITMMALTSIWVTRMSREPGPEEA